MKTLRLIMLPTLCISVVCCNKLTIPDAYLNIPAEIVDVNQVDSLIDLISEIEYIPLESSTNSLVSDPRQLVVSPYGYTILDERHVKHFAEDGTYLFDIGRIGRGPGEYSVPMSVCYDNGYFFVNEQFRLLKYNAENGKFIGKIDLPRYCVQVIVKNDFVYCVDISGEHNIIYLTKLSNDKYCKVLYKGNDCDYYGYDFLPLLVSGDEVLFCDRFLGQIYQLKDGNVSLLISCDFGEQGVTKKMLKKRVKIDDMNVISEFGNSFMVGDDIVFEYKNYSQWEYTLCYVNPFTKRMMKLKSNSFGILNQPEYIDYWHSHCSDNEYVYRLIQPRANNIGMDSIDTIPVSFQTFKKIMSLTDDDNYYITKTKFKSL